MTDKKKHTKKEQKAAQTRVDILVKEAQTKIKEAEKIGDEFGVSFGFNPAYGMGGSYVPNPMNVEQWAGDPADYEVEKDENGEWQHTCDWNNISDGEGYWAASSSSC